MSPFASMFSHRSLERFIVTVLLLLVAVPLKAQEPFGEPREVRIALLLTDLTEVNGAEQSFSADVFMAASWHDPELVDGSAGLRTLAYDDVWHPTLLIYNRRSVTESMPNEVVVRPDGTVTYAQRFTGEFSSPMSLRDFPRDSQEFFVWLSWSGPTSPW